jgi:predicted RNase H-like nuclease (RuvC/YqgF family)
VHLQSQVNSKDANIINLQSEISTKDGDIKQLKRSLQAESTAVKGMEMRYTSLQDKERELSSLKTALEANKEETRRLQGRVDISTSLLKSHPIDPCLNNKTKKILRSSAEILELAHDSGSVESMRRCLGQVGEILVDLHEQLDSQHRLSSAWLDQVRGI